MSISRRLKEERQRLNMSQTAFAGIAGVTKSAQIKWESGSSSSPTAPALAAWAEAGADVLYIVTGRRLPEMPDPDDEMVRDDLDEIRREMIAPIRRPDETDEQSEARTIKKAKICLERMVCAEVAPSLPADVLEQAHALLEAVNDPHKLSLLRAADYAQARHRRDHEKEMLEIWLKGWPYQPDHAVLELMARISLEYRVPHRTLVDLSHAIYTDIEEQQSAERVIRLAEQNGPS
ncbi:MAG: helix-turn-helix transcriptional regulator [Novosphingobium sp.]|nr:helix-turn-helix transcriptional regulator [Novosphingobium sp.]